LFPDAVNLLKWLREHGKKVYLLSNAQAVFTEYEMEQLGIRNLFDGILYSSDAGYRKPSERFYGKLLEEYSLDINDCVMIGNDAHSDIKGAHDMGIDSIYLHTVQSGKHPNKLPDDCREYDSLSVVLNELI
jgi:putative hydrolase of the HAD superfamily